MPQVEVTNNTRGPRVVNIDTGAKDKDGNPIAGQETIPAGATVKLNLLKDPKDDPVVRGMYENGEISLGGKRAKTFADHDKLTADRESFEKEREALAAKEAELAKRESELAVQKDQFQNLQREAATKAGQDPGLANPPAKPEQPKHGEQKAAEKK